MTRLGHGWSSVSRHRVETNEGAADSRGGAQSSDQQFCRKKLQHWVWLGHVWMQRQNLYVQIPSMAAKTKILDTVGTRLVRPQSLVNVENQTPNNLVGSKSVHKDVSGGLAEPRR